jgi:hypothetical protein
MKNNIKTLVLVLIISIFSLTTFASNTTGEEDLATFTNPGDPGGDPGASPINDYLLPMLVLGIAVGYRLLRKRTAIVK